MTNIPPGSANEILADKPLTASQFLVLGVCFFSMMLDGLDMMIAPYTAPALARDLSYTQEQIGLVFSSSLVGMAVGALVLSSLADIYGRTRLIVFALVLSGVTTVAIFWVTSPALFMAVRFVTGIGLGTMIAVLPGLGAEFSPAKQRELILSILVAGASVGTVVGGVIAAWAIPAFGWRYFYVQTGVAMVLVGLLFHLLIPESIQFILSRNKQDTLRKLNASLRRLGHAPVNELPPRTGKAVESATVKSLVVPARRRTTLLAWGAFFLTFASMYFIGSWLPKILVDVGMPDSQAIHASVILNTGAIIGIILIGFLSRYFRLNKMIPLAFLIAFVILLMMSLLFRSSDSLSFPLVLGLAFLSGIFLNGGFGNLYAIAAIIYPPQIRMTGIGWCVGLGRLGAIISPALAGFLLGLGVAPADLLALFAVAILLAALVTKLIQLREMS